MKILNSLARLIFVYAAMYGLFLITIFFFFESGAQQIPDYQRSAFRHWIDEDRDCQNTRHETLILWSDSDVTFTNERECTVANGRWHDPYTGGTYTSARRMDVDHVVPLAWAWEAGAWEWTPELRREFANDHINLIPVYLGANRSKGAKGPIDWLPPVEAYRCQYILLFERVVVHYQLHVPAEIPHLLDHYCYRQWRTTP